VELGEEALRRGAEEARRVISAIVLAAGTSSRFGSTKQLLPHRGKLLVQHPVDAAREAGLDEIIVVLGHDADRVEEALALPENARVVRNPRYALGQSTSLAAGLEAADPSSEAAVVLLADQPGITAAHIRALIGAFEAGGSPIVRLRFRNGIGPSLLSREIWDDARRLVGDVGARALASEHPDWVQEVVLEEDVPPDVDAPGDLDTLG
jgi:molybdenum cofactor cytidylyltransferase